MRDPELMLSLLKEMSEEDMGRLLVPMTLSMSEEAQHRRHHVELLTDAGHAEWVGDKQQVARITNTGYDFLNAANNPENGERARGRFIDLFNGGVAYGRAAQAAIELVAKAMGA